MAFNSVMMSASPVILPGTSPVNLVENFIQRGEFCHSRCRLLLRRRSWRSGSFSRRESSCSRSFLSGRGHCRQRNRTMAFASYDGKEEDGVGKSPSDETLEMVGWPSLCNAVAGFAATDMGRQLLLTLTLPSTKEESQALLDETSAGLEIESVVGGILDFAVVQTSTVKGGLDRVSRGVVISGQELTAIATLLQVAHKLQRGISMLADHQENGRHENVQPVARLVEPMLVHKELFELIWSKLDEDGEVKDSASPQVRQSRSHVQQLEQRLQQLLNRLVRETSEDDTQQVIEVGGRLCLPLGLGAGKGNSIPGLNFQHGDTAYLEPSQAVSLNNELVEARAEVQNAEHVVLIDISSKLKPLVSDVYYVLHSIVRLDVVGARGKYSSSIGGRMPTFSEKTYGNTHSNSEDDHEDNPLIINLRKFRHPILIDQHYWALRKSREKLKDLKKLLGRMRARVTFTEDNLASMEAAVAEAEAVVMAVEENPPVPIDVHISRNTRVVAITGPNTGGKTAAIKAVGLAALMSKCGLYIPAMDPVHIPWFDAVLADIGDEQSLSQSLSTYSGHLLRIKRIMSESTEDSLVLLDELGAGTDPTEGASLGIAVLEWFAEGRSLLTLATTHHEVLKTLKYNDKRFENVSVEFDNERLVPTYKLLWGIPGRSNALNIAKRLGLPNEIIVSAQNLYGAASAELNEVLFKLEGATVDFGQDWNRLEFVTAKIKERHSQLIEGTESIYDHHTVVQAEKCEQLAGISGAAHSRLGAIARKQGTSFYQASSSLQPSVVTESEPINTRNVPQKGKVSGTAMPVIGQLVYVPKLGREAKVTETNIARQEVTVHCGLLQIIVPWKEVQ